MAKYAVICTEPWQEEFGDGAEVIYEGSPICPLPVEEQMSEAVVTYCVTAELEGCFDHITGFPDATWRFDVKNLETGDIVTMAAETFFEPDYQVRRVNG